MIVAGIFSSIGDYFKSAAIWAIDQLIISVGALVNAIVSACPSMPSAPDLGLASYLPATVVEWLNWGNNWFPFDYLVGTLIPLVVALWVALYVLMLALRWTRAVAGDA